MKQVALQVFALFITHTALAQSAISTSVTDVKATSPNKKFGAIVSLSSETNLEAQNSSEDDTKSTLEITPSYRIFSKASLNALLAIEHSHNGLQETKFLNTTVNIVRDPLPIGEDTHLSLSLQAVLPTDKEANDKSSLRGGAGASATVSHEFKLLGKNTTVSYGLSGLKSSHRFTRNSENEANISYRIRQSGSLDVSVNDKLTASLGGYYQTGRTYDNVLRETYSLAESLSYDLKKNVAIAVSHSTGGPLFENGGHEWAASFYDKRSSTIGAKLTVVY